MLYSSVVYFIINSYGLERTTFDTEPQKKRQVMQYNIVNLLWGKKEYCCLF